MSSQAKKQGGKFGRVGFLTPNQMADRFIKLGKAWITLAADHPKYDAQRKAYIDWTKDVFSSPLDVIFQSETMEVYNEWREKYRIAHESASKTAKKTRAPSPKSIRKARAPAGMPWWGWLIGGTIGFLTLREVLRIAK